MSRHHAAIPARRRIAWSRAVRERDGYRCQVEVAPGVVCGAWADTADHVIPVALRPDLALDLANGRAACWHHNSARGAGGRTAAPVPRPWSW